MGGRAVSDLDQKLAHTVQAFGLRGFPYDPNEALNPNTHPDHDRLISRVDGWSQVGALEQLLAERAPVGEPTVIVVWGGSGCGRSTLANYLVHHWALERKELNPDHLYIANKPIKDYLAADHLWNWVLSFRKWALHKDLKLGSTTQDSFRELAKARPAALSDALQEVMSAFAKDLRVDHSGAFAGILEGVNDPLYLTEVTRCVEYVDTCVVMTIEETEETRATLIDRLDQLLDPDVGRAIQLADLDGKDMVTLASDRRQRFAPDGVAAPFDPAGFATAFGDQRRSFKLALTLLRAFLMDLDASKRLTAEEAAAKMQNFDSVLSVGQKKKK
jgi:hypothetical protein